MARKPAKRVEFTLFDLVYNSGPIAECRAKCLAASMAMPPRAPSSKNRTDSSRRSPAFRPSL
jgi:hypothetical protein